MSTGWRRAHHAHRPRCSTSCRHICGTGSAPSKWPPFRSWALPRPGPELPGTAVAETAQELAWLQDGDCDLIQGYLTSRPLPAADLHVWLERDPALMAACCRDQRRVRLRYSTREQVTSRGTWSPIAWFTLLAGDIYGPGTSTRKTGGPSGSTGCRSHWVHRGRAFRPSRCRRRTWPPSSRARCPPALRLPGESSFTQR